MPAANKKQLAKIQRQKADLRDVLWPDLDENKLWHYQNSPGWLNIPRTMPLLMQIMDALSNGKPVSSVYLDLWCRTYNDSFVVASKRREMAFVSGFSGERAERTWASRIRILVDLGFIETKPGPNGEISYILILNPYSIIKKLNAEGRIPQNYYNALLERMIEINGKDLQDAPEEAPAAA